MTPVTPRPPLQCHTGEENVSHTHIHRIRNEWENVDKRTRVEGKPLHPDPAIIVIIKL